MWDGRDADGWSNLFTEDASWEMHDSGSAGTEVTVRSRSEIRAAAGSAFADRVGVRACHHQDNTLITDMGEDSVHSRCWPAGTAFMEVRSPGRAAGVPYPYSSSVAVPVVDSSSRRARRPRSPRSTRPASTAATRRSARST